MYNACIAAYVSKRVVIVCVEFVTMADDSYRRLLAEFHSRGNYGVVFRNAMEDVADKMDFGFVRSCVAFGPGSGGCQSTRHTVNSSQPKIV